MMKAVRQRKAIGCSISHQAERNVACRQAGQLAMKRWLEDVCQICAAMPSLPVSMGISTLPSPRSVAITASSSSRSRLGLWLAKCTVRNGY